MDLFTNLDLEQVLQHVERALILLTLIGILILQCRNRKKSERAIQGVIVKTTEKGTNTSPEYEGLQQAQVESNSNDVIIEMEDIDVSVSLMS